MNLLKLLRKLKGSRLDEAHYELLRQAAELQDEKLALIQNANKILQENNDLIKDKVRRLEDEISRMRRYLLNQQVVTAAPTTAGPAKHIQEISDMTVAVLQECLKRNLVEFNCAEMAGCLSCEKSKVKTALKELVESGLIHRDSTPPGEATYRLTATGKSYAKTISVGNSA
ncbi:MAG: hypothetical protein P1P89_13530 [Desulfobacterales bacterium]|nr:hypothetical protein [Desulfobacterales bacterium]